MEFAAQRSFLPKAGTAHLRAGARLPTAFMSDFFGASNNRENGGALLRAFFIGLQFLTRISIVEQKDWCEKDFADSVRYFPLIGLVLGIIYAAFAALLLRLLPEHGVFVPPHVVAATLLMLPILLTGGLHCDGFMDTMDGLFSGRSRERMLEIMKDSRVGANGVFAFVLLVLFNWSVLLDLLQSPWLFPALFVMPIVSRLMMVVAIAAFPYARPAGMGKAFKDGGTKSVLCAAFCYTLLLLLLPGVVAEFSRTAFVMGTGALSAWLISMTAAFSIALLFAVFFARYAVRHLGGLTGDVYGAITTLVEALVLLSFLLFPSFLPFPC